VRNGRKKQKGGEKDILYTGKTQTMTSLVFLPGAATAVHNEGMKEKKKGGGKQKRKKPANAMFKLHLGEEKCHNNQ